MPVPSSINDLSTVAGSNPPGGGETPSEGDNHIRAAYSFIAALRDILNGTSSSTATVQSLAVSGAAAFGGAVTFNGAVTANSTFTANGSTTLGNASSDTLTVTATSSFAESIAAARGLSAGNTAVTAVNVMDFYLEEPAWTPTTVGASTAGTTTYTFQGGSYTRIGNRVLAQFEVLYSAATGIGSLVLNLPVAAKVSVISDATLGFGYVATDTPFAELVEICAQAGSSGSQARFQYKNGTSIGTVAISNVPATIKGFLVYEAA